MTAESRHDFLWRVLQQIVALTDVVELVVFHHQVMHAADGRCNECDAVVASVDVHEVGRHRSQHEVADVNRPGYLGGCFV